MLQAVFFWLLIISFKIPEKEIPDSRIDIGEYFSRIKQRCDNKSAFDWI